MPSWAKTALDGWATAAGVTTGAVLRRVDKGGRDGSSPITAQAVFEAVVGYARKAGLGKITPHDLRRTFSKLAHLGRAPLEQIQISLGHASIQTTERYLGLKQNLHGRWTPEVRQACGDLSCCRLGRGGQNVNLERPPKHPMHSGVNHSPGCWVASLTTSPSDGVVNNCGNAASQGSAGVAGWVRSRISHFLTTKVGDGIRSSWAAPTQS